MLAMLTRVGVHFLSFPDFLPVSVGPRHVQTDKGGCSPSDAPLCPHTAPWGSVGESLRCKRSLGKRDQRGAVRSPLMRAFPGGTAGGMKERRLETSPL